MRKSFAGPIVGRFGMTFEHDLRPFHDKSCIDMALVSYCLLLHMTKDVFLLSLQQLWCISCRHVSNWLLKDSLSFYRIIVRRRQYQEILGRCGSGGGVFVMLNLLFEVGFMAIRASEESSSMKCLFL